MTHKDAAREAVYEFLEEMRAALGTPMAPREDILRWAMDTGAAIAAERDRCADICDKESLWQKQDAGIVAARKCASLIRGQNG